MFQYKLKTLKLLRVKPGDLEQVFRLNTYMAYFWRKKRMIPTTITRTGQHYFSSIISLNAFILFVL